MMRTTITKKTPHARREFLCKNVSLLSFLAGLFDALAGGHPALDKGRKHRKVNGDGARKLEPLKQRYDVRVFY